MFAGQGYLSGDQVERVPSVTVHHSAVDHTQLSRYAYGADNDDYRLINFGAAMLYNHKSPSTVSNYWSTDGEGGIPDESQRSLVPFTRYVDVDFNAVEDIYPGDEMFANYGSNWFEDRAMTDAGAEVEPHISRSLSDLEATGHCLSDVYVDASAIPSAGRGVFASRAFAEGEVVSISPVLILPRHLLERPESNTVMLNYAVSANGTDVAILPIGTGAMINNGRTDKANVKLEWYEWSTHTSGGRPAALTSRTIDELDESPFSALDVSYRATRDIAKDEEILLDYGAEWSEAWEHYLVARADASAPVPALFRSPVGAPPGLFPEPWLGLKCFGQHCRRLARYKVKQRMAQQQQHGGSNGNKQDAQDEL